MLAPAGDEVIALDEMPRLCRHWSYTPPSINSGSFTNVETHIVARLDNALDAAAAAAIGLGYKAHCHRERLDGDATAGTITRSSLAGSARGCAYVGRRDDGALAHTAGTRRSQSAIGPRCRERACGPRRRVSARRGHRRQRPPQRGCGALVHRTTCSGRTRDVFWRQAATSFTPGRQEQM